MSPSNTGNAVECLPVEIWVHVFDYLRWDFWSTLQALSQSCGALNNAISPLLFQTLYIQFPEKEATIRIRKLLDRIQQSSESRVYHHARSLIVSYGSSFKDEYLGAIGKFVESLPNVKIIRWRLLPFPPNLFSNLKKRRSPPSFFYEGPPIDILEQNITAAPNILSLSLTFRPDRAGGAKINCDTLRDVLLSLPNLKRLILKHHPAAGWAQCLSGCSSLRRLALDGSTDLCELIDLLSSLDSLTSLKSLSVRIGDESTPMITGPKISKALNALVSQIHGLAEFMAYDLPKDVLYSVARHHGSSIRHLRFRHTDHKGLHSHRILQRNTGELPPQAREGSFYRGCLFSPDELEDLSRQVPELERLGIDMCFAGAMPVNHLDSLGWFPSLRYLELNTPLAEQMPTHYISKSSDRPWLDATIAREIFSHVAEQKLLRRAACPRPNCDSVDWKPLEEVDIKQGEWEPRLQYYRHSRLHHLSIYACWRGCAGTNNQQTLVQEPEELPSISLGAVDTEHPANEAISSLKVQGPVMGGIVTSDKAFPLGPSGYSTSAGEKEVSAGMSPSKRHETKKHSLKRRPPRTVSR
ncbi:hypothetical protein BJX66DRAFT_326899 [Aspergillus keveii]|uniref:F-box domain-containing protein n=1 Tax=Aspergillus keveii TaxID=714993 RepID=A0ABR4FZT8_9EURO